MSARAHNGSFAYHAQAIGLSAMLSRPSRENIPGLASVSLSQTGGESYCVVRDYNYKGLITFDEASSYVTGNRLGREYNTLATVTIRNLNVLNMVQAETVVARVTSLHKRGDDEGEITFAGSMIRNLTIAGHTMDVALDHRTFSEYPTYDSFRERLDKLRSVNARAAVRGNVVTASLVSGDLKSPVGTSEGYTIHLPEFGTIFVAQVLMKPGARRVSMLRFELGSPIAGSLEVCGGESNGSEYWP